jgi:hypothetical protein
MKPKKGNSFFLKVNGQFSFCIALTNKSDEDGEYKIVRTAFTEKKSDSLNLPLSEVVFFDFNEDESIQIEEWDSQSVKSLTKKILYGSNLTQKTVETVVVDSNTQSEEEEDFSKFLDVN